MAVPPIQEKQTKSKLSRRLDELLPSTVKQDSVTSPSLKSGKSLGKRLDDLLPSATTVQESTGVSLKEPSTPSRLGKRLDEMFKDIDEVREFNRKRPDTFIGEYRPGFIERSLVSMAQLPKRLQKNAASQLGPEMTMDAIMASSGMHVNDQVPDRNPLTELKKTLSQDLPEAEGWKEVFADIVGDVPSGVGAFNIAKSVTRQIAQATFRRGGRGALASMIFDMSEDQDISITQAALAAGLDITTGGIGSKIMNMAKELKKFRVPKGIDELFPGSPVRPGLESGSKIPFVDILSRARTIVSENTSQFNSSRLRTTNTSGKGIGRTINGLNQFGDIPEGGRLRDYKFMMFDPVDDVIYADDLLHMGGLDGLIKSGVSEGDAAKIFGRSISVTLDETGNIITPGGPLDDAVSAKLFKSLRQSGFNFEQLENIIPKKLALKVERSIEELTRKGEIFTSPSMDKLNRDINSLIKSKNVSKASLFRALEDGFGINDMKFVGEDAIPRESAEEIFRRLTEMKSHWPEEIKAYFLRTNDFPLEPSGLLGRPEVGRLGQLIKSTRFMGYKLFQSLETTLGKFGGSSLEIRDRVLKASAWQDGRSGKQFGIVDDLAAMFDGDDRMAAQFLRDYQKGLIDEGSPEILQRAANLIRPEIESQFTIASASGLRVRLAGGGSKKIEAIKNYIPHSFEYDALKNKTMQENLIQNWMTNNGLSRGEAVLELNRLAKMRKTRLDPNLEHERIYDTGGWVGDPNSKDFTIDSMAMGLKSYFANSNRRLSEAIFMDSNGKRFFGRGWKSFSELAGSEGDPDVQKFLFDAISRIKGLDAGEQENLALSVLRNYQVYNKLGLASIPNFFQVGITVLPKTVSLGLARGIKNTWKGIEGLKKDPSFAVNEAGAAMSQSLREITGLSQGGWSGKVAGGVLKWSGFTAEERANNIIAAGAGRAHIKDAMEIVSRGKDSPLFQPGVRFQGRTKPPSTKHIDRTISNARKELKTLGITDDAIRRGSLTNREISEASWRMARLTQFRASPLDLPLLWSTPYGRLITQFKTFGFSINKLMWNHAVKPMATYVKTGGKEGTPVPLITMAASSFGTGEVIAGIRSMLINGRDRPEEWWARFAEDISWSGSLGMYLDLYQQSARGKGLETLVGPTISDVERHRSLLSRGEFLESARQMTPLGRIGRLKPNQKKSKRSFP